MKLKVWRICKLVSEYNLHKSINVAFINKRIEDMPEEIQRLKLEAYCDLLKKSTPQVLEHLGVK